MIGLDTNVLVRLITNDDARQAARVEKVIAERCSVDSPALVNSVVLVELVWVLESAYEYSREQIVEAVETLLQVKELEVLYAEQVWEALHRYKASNVGLADFFIASINRYHGCETTLTFDRKAAKYEGFEKV